MVTLPQRSWTKRLGCSFGLGQLCLHPSPQQSLLPPRHYRHELVVDHTELGLFCPVLVLLVPAFGFAEASDLLALRC